MDRVNFTLGVIEVNGVEWLRCTYRPATLEYDSELPIGRETCTLVGVAPLVAGDTLRLRARGKATPFVVAASSTYFGIVKLD